MTEIKKHKNKDQERFIWTDQRLDTAKERNQ